MKKFRAFCRILNEVAIDQISPCLDNSRDGCELSVASSNSQLKTGILPDRVWRQQIPVVKPEACFTQIFCAQILPAAGAAEILSLVRLLLRVIVRIIARKHCTKTR
jgi:hypothetical protein